MKNYTPTNEDARIQSQMMDIGFKVYPVCTTVGIRRSPVYLAFEYKGVVTKSKDQSGFPQNELSYHIIELYKKLYNLTINKNG